MGWGVTAGSARKGSPWQLWGTGNKDGRRYGAVAKYGVRASRETSGPKKASEPDP